MQIRRTDPDDPRAQACLAAYSALLGQAVPDIGADPIPVPLADAEDFRAPHGACLLASDGRPLGVVMLRRLDATTAEVKRLYVMEEARGLGLARRLMAAIEEEARVLGYRALKLDSNRALTPALALYEATGWSAIPAYTDYPATHWYGKTL